MDYDRNKDSGTFTLNISEQGIPNPDDGKQYGKQFFGNEGRNLQIVHYNERDTGYTTLTDGKFTHHKNEAGTFKLNMEASTEIKPGAHYQPNDRVTHRGTQIQAKVAARMGLLVSDGMGGYYSPFDQGSKQAAPRQFDPSRPAYIPERFAHKFDIREQREGGSDKRLPSDGSIDNDLKEAEANGMNPMESEVEQQFSNALSAIKPMTSRQTMLELSKGEGFSEGTISRLAEESGLSVEQADAVANDLYSKFETQAHKTVEDMGLDSEDLFDWAWENQPEMMQDAMRRHGFERTTSGYREIANAYLIDLAKSCPEDILEAEFGPGITAAREGNTIVLHTPRGSYEWVSALRAGIFTVSRSKRS